jgi:hypothetical protein
MGLLLRPDGAVSTAGWSTRRSARSTGGEKNGITRAEAERGLRRLVEVEFQRPPQAAEVRTRTVDEVTNSLRERLAIEGARLSYRQNCESMQGVEAVSRRFGSSIRMLSAIGCNVRAPTHRARSTCRAHKACNRRGEGVGRRRVVLACPRATVTGGSVGARRRSHPGASHR